MGEVGDGRAVGCDWDGEEEEGEGGREDQQEGRGGCHGCGLRVGMGLDQSRAGQGGWRKEGKECDASGAEAEESEWDILPRGERRVSSAGCRAGGKEQSLSSREQ